MATFTFRLAKAMTELHFKNPHGRRPRLLIWTTIALLVPMMFYSRWKFRRRDRKAMRLLRTRTPAGTNLISPHMEYDRDGFPNEPALRGWLQAYLGRPVTRGMTHDLLKACWRAQGKDLLYVFEADEVYLDLTEASQRQRTPFEVADNGGHFVFLTNRHNRFVSYLLPTVDRQTLRSYPACPGEGYTNLWVLRHVSSFAPQASEPRAWAPLPHETDYKASPGLGPWIALRDPRYDKWRTPHSWRTIIGRFSNAESANALAREFCARNNIHTCTAEIVDDWNWH